MLDQIRCEACGNFTDKNYSSQGLLLTLCLDCSINDRIPADPDVMSDVELREDEELGVARVARCDVCDGVISYIHTSFSGVLSTDQWCNCN